MNFLFFYNKILTKIQRNKSNGLKGVFIDLEMLNAFKYES